MKNARYVLSICSGIIMGAVVALVAGDTITAVLSGVITAGVTAWIGSLQLERARGVAADVTEWLSHSSSTAAQGTLKVARKTPYAIGATIWFLCSITRSVLVDTKTQKVVMGLLTIPVLLVPVAYSIASPLVAKSGIPVATLACVVMLAIQVVMSVIILVAVDKYNTAKYFLGGWLVQMIDDEHGVFMTTARMLYVRTGNALKILTFPFILALWLLVALANNKTGASALAAMALSGVHLTVALFAGGIDTANVNFWLSLSVALGAGAVIGRKVRYMKGEWSYPFPSITFRHQ